MLKMKYIVRNLVAAGAILAASGVSADFLADLQPVIGVDYYQAWMKGKNFNNRVLPKSYPGATIYVGTRFNECFGIELGYDWSANKKKSWTVSQNTTVSGVTANNTITGTSKVRRSGGHLDLVGFIPVADCFEVFGTLGYGWVQARVKETNVSVTGANLTLAQRSAIANGITSGSTKGRSVFRLGVGANYMVTDCVGLRAKLGWETTSGLKHHHHTNTAVYGFSNRGFKDSGTLALGAFVKF